MNVLGMFARFPQPGACKTRLAESIGPAGAAELYAAFVTDLMNRFSCVDADFHVLATPENDESQRWFSDRLPETAQLLWQPESSFGDRIDWFFRPAAASETSRVLIGSDSPDLPDEIISAAFEQLQTRDVVFSPAADGGMVLIGCRTWREGLFDSVQWSCPTTLCMAIEAARRSSLSVGLLNPWYDVDDQNSLGTLMARQIHGETQTSAVCPTTREALLKLNE